MLSATLAILGTSVQAEELNEGDVVALACKFERLPLMILTYRWSEDRRTLQVGDNKPVPMIVGSGYSGAVFEGQDYSFWLRRPANVTISGRGSDAQTFNVECVSTLSRD